MTANSNARSGMTLLNDAELDVVTGGTGDLTLAKTPAQLAAENLTLIRTVELPQLPPFHVAVPH